MCAGKRRAAVAVRSVGGEGRKEGRDKRGGDRRYVIYLAKRMTGGMDPHRESVCPLRSARSSSLKRHLDPDPVTRRGILLARVAFDDDN